MSRVKGELKLISKHASMVITQVGQVLKAQNDLLNELNNKKNDNDVRVMTSGGKMTQEPLYPEGHPKRIEQDSQRTNVDAPSPSKKKKKNDRTLHASSELVVDTPENPNDISISDAETQSGDEHEPSDNVNDNVHVDAQPSKNNDVEMNLMLILITHNQRINVMIREILLLGSTVEKENHGFRNPCPFLLNHPRQRMMRILSALLK